MLSSLIRLLRKLQKCVPLCALVSIFGVSWAASASAQTFEELEVLLAKHPALASFQFKQNAEQETAKAAFGLPDPTVSIGINNVPVTDPAFDRFLPTNKAIGVKQSLPNLKKRRASAEISSRQSDMTITEGKWAFQQFRAKLIATLAERNSLERQLVLLSQRDRKYNELEEVIASEIDAGRPVAFRIADLDIERADIIRERAALTAAQSAAHATLLELVGITPTTTPPDISLAQWDGNAQTFYAVLLADREVSIAAAKIKLAEAAFGPDWGLSLTYQQREDGAGTPGSVFDGEDWFSAGVSVTIPLWSRSNQQPKLRAAKASKSASQSRYDATLRLARAEWTSLQAEIKASTEIIDVLNLKIKSLGSRAAALTNNYEAGLTDYTPVLDSEIARLKLQGQLAHEQARRITLIAKANSLLVTS